MSFFLRKVLSPSQCGSMFGRSTTSNLACFMNTAATIVCNQGQLDVVYFDPQQGIRRNLPQSFVIGAIRFGCGYKAIYPDVKTEPYPYGLPPSVPQGSALGPLLILFANDVSSALSHPFHSIVF